MEAAADSAGSVACLVPAIMKTSEKYKDLTDRIDEVRVDIM